MTKAETINLAISALIDAGTDPRSALIRDLAAIGNEPDAPGVGDIELVATIESGGRFGVKSADGRVVRGVKAVACFPDERTGQHIMQVTL